MKIRTILATPINHFYIVCFPLNPSVLYTDDLDKLDLSKFKVVFAENPFEISSFNKDLVPKLIEKLTQKFIQNLIKNSLK